MPSERMPQRADSWMSPLLKWLTLAVVRFPSVTLVLAVAVAGVSILLTTTRLGFHTSRAELLNPKSDYNRRWLEYTKEFGDKEDVVVVVEGEGCDQTIPAVDDVCRGLARQSNLFSAVLHDIDAPKLRQKGVYYLKTEDLLRIDGFLNQAGPILARRLVAIEFRQHGPLDRRRHGRRLRSAAAANPRGRTARTAARAARTGRRPGPDRQV